MIKVLILLLTYNKVVLFRFGSINPIDTECFCTRRNTTYVLNFDKKIKSFNRVFT